jgi:glycine cleavage system pyridoxal-binding protein P
VTSHSSRSLSSVEEWGIIGGYDLGQEYPRLENHMLLCVTEVIARQEIDALVNALGEAAREVAS